MNLRNPNGLLRGSVLEWAMPKAVGISKLENFLLRIKSVTLYHELLYRTSPICGFDTFFLITLGSITLEYNVIVLFSLGQNVENITPNFVILSNHKHIQLQYF